MIHGDEYEYMQRAINSNVFVATVVDSLFYHPCNRADVYFLLNGAYRVRFSPWWMEYYEVRN